MNALLVAGVVILAFWLEGRRRATVRRLRGARVWASREYPANV